MDVQELPNVWIVTSAVIAGGVGIALLFVGVLISMLTAIGKGDRYWACGILVFFPLVFIYTLRDRDYTSYLTRLLYSGALFCVTFLLMMFVELNRIGLDFGDVMLSTKPVHALNTAGKESGE